MLEPHPSAAGTLGQIATAYNGQGQVSAVTDPRSLNTTYTVDGLGNLTQQRSPDSRTTGFTYDAAGNLKTRLDAGGVTTGRTYDALNRKRSTRIRSLMTISRVGLGCAAAEVN